jgi:hypothetical protein
MTHRDRNFFRDDRTITTSLPRPAISPGNPGLATRKYQIVLSRHYHAAVFFDVGICRHARCANRVFARENRASPPKSTLAYSNTTPTRHMILAAEDAEFPGQNRKSRITSMSQFASPDAFGRVCSRIGCGSALQHRCVSPSRFRVLFLSVLIRSVVISLREMATSRGA